MSTMTRVRVLVVPTLPERTVSVPLQMVGQPVLEAVVAFGTRSTHCSIINSSDTASSVQISTKVAERLGIEGEMRINARWDDSTLTLGPLIGIIADTHKKPDSLFGEQTTLFRELSEEARRRGAVLFVFTPYGINFSQRMIRGYTALPSDGSGAWQVRRFPFPKAVYDRSFYHPGEEKITDRILDRLSHQRDLTFVNHEIGDKWRVHQDLSRQPEIRPYLPETLLIGQGHELESFLGRHHLVYLKPAHGSQGRGVIRVERKSSGGFTLQFQQGAGEIRRSFGSWATLRAYLKSLFRGRRYLAQQGIELLKHRGALVDLRLIVQKASASEWTVTGMAARVGRKGSSVTNLHRGGHALAVPRLLAEHFPTRAPRLMTQIARLGCNVAASIERAYGSLGELGIDLGLDRHGNLWYIEANPKPGRRVFILINEPETRRKTIARPLEYAMTLADFPPPVARRDQDGN